MQFWWENTILRLWWKTWFYILKSILQLKFDFVIFFVLIGKSNFIILTENVIYSSNGNMVCHLSLNIWIYEFFQKTKFYGFCEKFWFCDFSLKIWFYNFDEKIDFIALVKNLNIWFYLKNLICHFSEKTYFLWFWILMVWK